MAVLLCLFHSAMAGPLEDPEGAEHRRERDASAAEEVLLLRPERGRAGPGAAESALCTGGSTPLCMFAPLRANRSGF